MRPVATEDDLARYAAHGVTVAHCPLVSARHGSDAQILLPLEGDGDPHRMGTDTAPPDMVLNMSVGLMMNRLAEGRGDAVPPPISTMPPPLPAPMR